MVTMASLETTTQQLSLRTPTPYYTNLQASLGPSMPPNELIHLIDSYLAPDITVLFIQTVLLDFIADEKTKEEIRKEATLFGKTVTHINLGDWFFLASGGWNLLKDNFFTQCVKNALVYFSKVTKIDAPFTCWDSTHPSETTGEFPPLSADQLEGITITNKDEPSFPNKHKCYLELNKVPERGEKQTPKPPRLRILADKKKVFATAITTDNNSWLENQ